eukprot:TRINITY_DN3173_c0_g2_i1.p3 TRINITY_DN3173_c0_g2~~TRINITY_DN3173_c0_g2_i1.p3  ORF type:complete len:134 (+),score=2.35 TRINITY_DN3173_c0_g2_i1:42-404(+)
MIYLVVPCDSGCGCFINNIISKQERKLKFETKVEPGYCFFDFTYLDYGIIKMICQQVCVFKNIKFGIALWRLVSRIKLSCRCTFFKRPLFVERDSSAFEIVMLFGVFISNNEVIGFHCLM